MKQFQANTFFSTRKNQMHINKLRFTLRGMNKLTTCFTENQ